MYVIAMISRKGGAGKTNLAVHLAACAEGKGFPTGIIDLDPQGTASKWGMRREENELRSGAEVMSAQPTGVRRLLDAARGAGAKLMIIDTAPHADSIAVDAARAADFVLIPCRPAIADLEAIPASADIARLAKKPFAVVLNSVGAQGAREIEARQELQRLGLDLAPAALGHRVAYADAMIPGEGVTEYRNGAQAASEIETLFEWLWKTVDGSTHRPVARS